MVLDTSLLPLLRSLVHEDLNRRRYLDREPTDSQLALFDLPSETTERCLQSTLLLRILTIHALRFAVYIRLVLSIGSEIVTSLSSTSLMSSFSQLNHVLSSALLDVRLSSSLTPAHIPAADPTEL